jgi:hypothetical protein
MRFANDTIPASPARISAVTRIFIIAVVAVVAQLVPPGLANVLGLIVADVEIICQLGGAAVDEIILLLAPLRLGNVVVVNVVLVSLCFFLRRRGRPWVRVIPHRQARGDVLLIRAAAIALRHLVHATRHPIGLRFIFARFDRHGGLAKQFVFIQNSFQFEQSGKNFIIVFLHGFLPTKSNQAIHCAAHMVARQRQRHLCIDSEA